jgi:hypothetical protein
MIHGRDKYEQQRRKNDYLEELKLEANISNNYEDAIRERMHSDTMQFTPTTLQMANAQIQNPKSTEQQLTEGFGQITTAAFAASVVDQIQNNYPDKLDLVLSYLPYIKDQMRSTNLYAENGDNILYDFIQKKIIQVEKDGGVPGQTNVMTKLLTPTDLANLDKLPPDRKLISIRATIESYLSNTYPNQFSDIGRTVSNDPSNQRPAADQASIDQRVLIFEKKIIPELQTIDYNAYVAINNKEKTLTPPQQKDRILGGGLSIGKEVVPRRRQTVSGTGRVIGHGIKEDYTVPYIQFGKFVIHIPSLHQNQLNVKYMKSFCAVPRMPRTVITTEFMHFLLHLLRDQKMDTSRLDKLGEEEQDLFHRLAVLAGVERGLGIAPLESDDKEVERFQLLQGEVMSGQNSPQVLKELRNLVVKFMADGRIKRYDGEKLLSQIILLL